MPHAITTPDALDLPRPYLLFLGEAADFPYAKTAQGLKDWAPEFCSGEFNCAGSETSVGLPRLTPREAHDRGARAAVIGVANIGGALKDSWIVSLIDAMHAGLDIVSGLHGRLADTPALGEAAARLGRRLIDVRVPPPRIPVASGRKRSGRRLLTVGTDCALGKKYTALSLARSFRSRGVACDFRATGQTGILIAGSGIPMDAVVADFVAGAAELLSPDADAAHWDLIEGQGSLFHPSYAGVSLGLLHGSQPDIIVLCHEVGRDYVMGLDGYRTPSLGETIEVTLKLASRTNRKVRCAGVAINTAGVSATEARAVLARHAAETELPAADPMRGGAEFERLVESCLKDG
ncbi:MAG TPA: DUF1611 domain-containing protein [Steroidobacteraceae bacterium]|jgi:uncharacterized NAD-dependent epimerase/dehydratase family protein